jgi:hypothetical protein
MAELDARVSWRTDGGAGDEAESRTAWLRFGHIIR